MAGVRTQGEKQGGNTPLLLTLLLLLVGLSAWNYQRNAALEKASPSPYASMSDANLDVLIAAYQSEIEGMQAKGGVGRRANARDTSGVASGVREFERVQRVSRSTREAGYAIAEREAAVAALEQEKARRARLGGGALQVFLRRAFTVSL